MRYVPDIKADIKEWKKEVEWLEKHGMKGSIDYEYAVHRLNECKLELLKVDKKIDCKKERNSMLQFFGNGSAFNTKLGNNSAFYKHEDQLFIIDCGSSIFQRIVESNILEGVKHIHVAITHTHADHVGSLGDLVLYSYYSMGILGEKAITIYTMPDVKVQKILKSNGCIKDEHYNLNMRNFVKLDFLDLFFVKTKHVKEIPSYGLDLTIYDQNKHHQIFYSGDMYEIPRLFLLSILDGNFDTVYLDTSGADYEGNVHLSFKKLCEIIPKSKKYVRNNVHCMHLDQSFDEKLAKNEGFRVTKSIFE